MGTNNFDANVIDSDGIAVKVGYCKCPECGVEQVARYGLPADSTMYDSCRHKHDGIPHSM